MIGFDIPPILLDGYSVDGVMIDTLRRLIRGMLGDAVWNRLARPTGLVRV